MLITKGNLLACKESLRLAKLGYELMDRKRIILMQELSKMMDDVKELRDVIDETYDKAYISLQRANVSLGVIDRIANLMPVEEDIKIVYRSVMGIEIPKVTIEEKEVKIPYALSVSNSRLDEVFLQMRQVKLYTAKLAELDNGMYRLAKAIEKSRKRANALEQIVIPDLEIKIKTISDALEEKEREEFIRMKLVKKM
ncbi:V-type ATP synthase subunit D [Erysipelothrix rhusiopathiae]|uniref:V-type ATPase, D subunit n=1 Tax=Erysipelothrix rhusiopathiae ATCC 19414 TaxID=525280 RepID=E7FUZ3_ERYRH|nr:V-type ATP synthase subunit D [Erysipelothrix rhusiopathiae]EFY09783.1 V-type ATPase, D subunit [Erysipelothrix rhusiopathiae ATCC 19414]MDE8342153.1 V-type ATP synthase subunit D [Erysipelothrix rhusiopathiae]MDV7680043.1 V-type ATP synthase subunit D [Erysipelothrix rhusiopathiae]RNM32218.1 V-type ATP synthase subunit D [Erysipelothrix rhusiopathiae]VEH84602.1 V-type sodium pump subunit D [Erysipelothrix rhusiopathiae]